MTPEPVHWEWVERQTEDQIPAQSGYQGPRGRQGMDSIGITAGGSRYSRSWVGQS